uniref:Uncharacterized protein n=1 Tax=Glycine max TaxID=3847 RepID=K7KGU9_SOYBN
MRFIKLWAFQLQQIAFVVWLSTYPKVIIYRYQSFPSCLSAANKWRGSDVNIVVFTKTSQRTSAQPTRMGVRTAECGGILGSNCKVQYLSLTLEVWASVGEFLRS